MFQIHLLPDKLLFSCQGLFPSSGHWVEQGGTSSLSAWRVKWQWESQQVSTTQDVNKHVILHKIHFFFNQIGSPFESIFIPGANLTQTLPQSFPQGGPPETPCCPTFDYRLLHVLVTFLVMILITREEGLDLDKKEWGLHAWNHVPYISAFCWPHLMHIPTAILSFPSAILSIPSVTGATNTPPKLSLYTESHLCIFSPFSLHHVPPVNSITSP